MSNNRKSGNNFALKLFATVTSLLLAASVITTGVCFATNTWQVTPKDDVVQEQPGDETPAGDEGGLVVNQPVNNGISLMSAKIAAADFDEYGISPLAESAQQVTASVQPSDALNKEVDWSIAWANSSSSWASGKTVTDYVTVTPTSDGALTANVSCLQAFGEQIVVTATSRDNTSAKGTCTVDYRQKYLGTETNINFNNSQYYQIGQVKTFKDKLSTVNLPNKAQTGFNTNTMYSPKDNMAYGAVLSETYSLPLEDGDISYKYYIKMNPTLATALKSADTNFKDENMAVNWKLFNEASGTLSEADTTPMSGQGVLSAEQYTVIDYYYTLCGMLRTGIAQNVWYINSYYLVPFIRAAQGIDDYHFEVKVVAEFGGETYETVSKMKFSEDSLTIPVQSVSAGPNLKF